jgi:hypothetical protein
VPYDPHLPLLFFGEELLQLARMWTRGWRVFAPTNSVVFHLWSRDNRETFAVKVLRRAAASRKHMKMENDLSLQYRVNHYKWAFPYSRLGLLGSGFAP